MHSYTGTMKSLKQRLKKNEVNIRYKFYCFEKVVKTLDQAHNMSSINLSVCNNGAVIGQSARGCTVSCILFC